MKFHWDIVQGSEEWLKLRSGKITGSVASVLLVNGKDKSGLGAGAFTELYRVAEERLTGTPRDSFGGNRATDWGHENESLAIDLYQAMNFVNVSAIGFVEKNDLIGSSPDGIIKELKKGVEVKCRPKEHLKLVMTNEYLSSDYVQCQFNMWCTGYKEWDLIYFHPNLPEKSKIKVFSFKYDKEMISKFEKRTRVFSDLLNQIIKKAA